MTPEFEQREAAPMIHEIILRILAFLLFTTTLSAQHAQWAHSIGDSSGNTAVRAIARYTDDAVLIAGGFNGRDLTLGSFTLNNEGNTDAFIAIIDRDGAALWARSFGGRGDDQATAVAADMQGNIYLAVTFKSLSIAIGVQSFSNRGESDAVLIRFTADGNIDWALHIGDSRDDDITAVAVDMHSDVHIVGRQATTQVPWDISAFMIKLDGTGALLWQQRSQGNNIIYTSLALDDDGNSYIGASFSGNIAFDSGQEISSTEGQSGLIVQYTENGVHERTAILAHFSAVNALQIHADALYAAGEKRNYGMRWGWPAMDSEILLTKYTRALDVIWERSAGGETHLHSLDIVHDLSCDEKGNIYLTGSFFSDTLRFGGELLLNVLNKDYHYQRVFVLQYDSAGTEIRGKALGGLLNDVGSAILALGEDSFMLAGHFESDELSIDGHVLHNTAPTREIYVHLSPPRFGRNANAFLARFDAATSGAARPAGPSLASLYPNPATDLLHLRLRKGGGEMLTILLYNIEGRLLHTMELYDSMQTISLDISGFESGSHFMTLIRGKQLEVHRWIRQ
jgi:hypothetical protein